MADPKPLRDKVILVTGAAQGLGLAISRYVAARGASLSLADVQKGKLDAAAQQVAEAYPDIRVSTWEVDITDPKAVEDWVAISKARFGKINGCVNNAGILEPDSRPTEELSYETWTKVIDVNLTGLFNCLKYELRAIVDEGSIVNIASVAGVYGFKAHPAYVASKHGVIGLTRVTAAEQAHRGVRINAVCPSFADTSLIEELVEKSPEYHPRNLPQLFKRFVPKEDVASMVGYLLGDESKIITQAILRVDGGFAA